MDLVCYQIIFLIWYDNIKEKKKEKEFGCLKKKLAFGSLESVYSVIFGSVCRKKKKKECSHECGLCKKEKK